MGAFSVATGLTLLYDEGVLPPNPERQAVAFASPADLAKLEGEGLAMKQTATDLAMEDNSAHGTVELSSAALQFLVQNLTETQTAPRTAASDSTTQQSGYPYSGWSESSNFTALQMSSSGIATQQASTTGTPSMAIAPASVSTPIPTAAAAPIDVLA